jgi:hypothetical protein
MADRVTQVVKSVLGLKHPGRQLLVFPDDVFIVSYPKSGNTWTRFLIANLVHPDKHPDFSNINQIIPEPEAASTRALAKIPRPRILKSHEYFDPRYRKIIYIVRDPRDVVLSQYHFHIKRGRIDESYSIEQFVDRFIAGETSTYASWGENVAGWLATRYNTPGFLLLRYEDMLANTVTELRKIADLLGIEADGQRLSVAVEQSSAERMRELEKKHSRNWYLTKNTRQDIPFVRTAKSGNWRSALPGSTLESIENAWGPLMRWLKYETVTHTKPDSAGLTLEAIIR